MDSKCTPGPWSFTVAHNGDCGIRAEGTGIFAEAFTDIRRGGENARAEALANAALIAAAPETAAERDRLRALNVNLRETLKGIAAMPDSDGARMRLWARDSLSGHTETLEATLLNVLNERNDLRALHAEMVEAASGVIENASVFEASDDNSPVVISCEAFRAMAAILAKAHEREGE